MRAAAAIGMLDEPASRIRRKGKRDFRMRDTEFIEQREKTPRLAHGRRRFSAVADEARQMRRARQFVRAWFQPAADDEAEHPRQPRRAVERIEETRAIDCQPAAVAA